MATKHYHIVAGRVRYRVVFRGATPFAVFVKYHRTFPRGRDGWVERVIWHSYDRKCPPAATFAIQAAKKVRNEQKRKITVAA
ncbi:MAG TPA: hypothetical protein VLJ17_24700 [Xanthobacteraceae bacterium]|nr:hypothetical protein [Xanthobacteraceae bacterium]